MSIADQRLSDDHLDVEARLAASGERKGLGAYYTPDWLVDVLLDLTLQPMLTALEPHGADSVASVRVIDPTCGSGNFLVRVVERIVASLKRSGMPAAEAGTVSLGCVAGVDLDQRAIDACRRRLVDVAESLGGRVDPDAAPRLWAADAFTLPDDATVHAGGDCGVGWVDVKNAVDAVDGFDLVIGNPPFLNQLRSDTAFGTAYAATLASLYPALFRGYTDAAALALVVARRLVRDGGRICLIQPTSTLASASVAAIRSLLTTTATMTDAWLADEPVFDDAAVDVWAPVFTASVGQGEVAVRAGRGTTVATTEVSTGPTWSPVLAAAKGVPQRHWDTVGSIGDIAGATADFRDQYYGLVGHVVDREEGSGTDTPKLVTSGLIDPADLMWGRITTRFNKTAYRHPRVEIATLDEPLINWAQQRLVPKVLVATQTRVLEAVVDATGSLLPSVPVITLTVDGADPVDLWKVAALLVSPPTSAIAASRHMGSALSNDALKLSASDLLALPLPEHTVPWDEAGRLFRAASDTDDGDERRRLLIESAVEMCAAFGHPNDDALLDWWAERLPRRSVRTTDDPAPSSAVPRMARRRGAS